MLISRVAELTEEADVGEARGEPASGARGGRGRGQARELYDHDYEFQTANELYDLMAKNYLFDETDENTLSKRDLVFLYKNIDIGTTLMSKANELKHRKPNQHVETIIYNDDPESDGSDVSEIYSTEDLHNLVLVNKERIDLFNNRPSVQNTLCHKLGGLEIQSSDLAAEYDNHFLFKDPYIKEQLNNFNLSCCSNGFEGTILPASLLDYICCKRLEDNHNFYMENVIRYVKHTIDQLKRISNGDYLTDKAKEKWREVEYTAKEHYEDNTKALATCTSIPLHVERKFGGHASTWDDIVHSEVDVRSLSKILEKKIVVEIPNILYGSYKLFSKRCDDNLIISCERDKPAVVCKREGKSRVDLVLQLQRSQSGLVMSNINSIVTLHTTPAVKRELGAIEVLPIPYDGNNYESTENQMKIIELRQNNVDTSILKVEKNKYCTVDTEEVPTEDGQYKNKPVLYNFDSSSNENKDIWQFNKNIFLKPTDSNDSFRDILNKKAQRLKKEASFNLVTPDDLWFTIQKLNMQSSLPEESAEDISVNVTNKKKSPTRVRIKSPYENKSFVMEEKKRKKLLEIREKREKKKIALGENCKITKHKYGKVVMPQASSSVTKLSITNKSFYNSIYGQAVNVENNQQKKGRMKRKDNIILEVPLAQTEEEYESPMETPERNSKKYEDRSYYLDDAVTEVMYMEMKKKESNGDKDLCSTSTSAVSNEICENFSLLSQLMAPSATEYSHLNINENTTTFDDKLNRLDVSIANNSKKEHKNNLISSRSILNMVPPTNSPVNQCTDVDKSDPKKITSSVECRKSIEKIYELMKKLGKIDQSEIKETTCKFTASNTESMEIICGRASSTIQGSDSGTSIKHNLTSSNPSCFSFQKTNTNEAMNLKIMLTKKPETATAAVPNVTKIGGDRMKKERKNVTVTHPSKGTDNPLKAISQLIHEFDNVQKIRQKNETKTVKKLDTSSIDGKCISRLTANQTSLKRRSRLEEHLNDKEIPIDRYTRATLRDRKIKQVPTIEVSKTLYQHFLTEEKNIERPKKKIIDITDEAKEARGEAVRGPSKMNRLNTLAQPKRSYVQAHSEEYQTKYGKNLMADRLHRLAATPAPGPVSERTFTSANSKYKLRRSGTEVVSSVSGRPPPPSAPPLDKPTKARRSKSSSPDGKLPPAIVPSLKTYIPDSPELLKKKMVSVESYMKNRRGRVTQAPGNTDLLQSVAKSRFPLIPRDIELESMTSSSVEESTHVGSKLHRIINTMINTTPSLAVLTECHETVSRKDNTGESMYLNTDNISQSLNNDDSISSNHRNVVFDDTQDSTPVKDVEKEEIKVIPEEDKIKTNEIESINSATEMEQLENALYRKMSGTFQKRLRIKNLTLTPKQSLQQVFVLQSGDAASMLVKSQTHKQNTSVKSEKSAFTTLPILTNSHIDWSFAKFPMQIATVEYGLPKYQTMQCGQSSKIKLDIMCQNCSDTNLLFENIDKSNKTSQCFKGQSIPQIGTTAETMQLTNSDNHEVKADCKKCNKMIEAGTEPRSNTQTPLTSKTIPIYDKKEKDNFANDTSQTETVDYTSSLDMLVGLLNEIQKITSCQANITNTQNNNEHKEIESVLNDAALFEGPVKTNPHELVSMSSLDELRQLDSNPSIYSFYFSNDGDRQAIDNEIKMDHDMSFKTYNIIDAPYSKPIYADKEVSVDVLDRRVYVNRFTEIPSHFFPKATNHSTSVTNSLVRVLSEPSCHQPTLLLKDYQSNCTNKMESKNNIIELRQVSTSTDSQHAFTVSRLPDDIIKKTVIKQKAITNIPVKCTKRNNVWSKKIVPNSNFLMNGQNRDPLIKMKRDILVTVYSILVLTVFAALSFPEMLYRT